MWCRGDAKRSWMAWRLWSASVRSGRMVVLGCCFSLLPSTVRYLVIIAARSLSTYLAPSRWYWAGSPGMPPSYARYRHMSVWCANCPHAHGSAFRGVQVCRTHVCCVDMGWSLVADVYRVFASGLDVTVRVHVDWANVCVVPDCFDDAVVKVARGHLPRSLLCGVG